MLFSSFSTRSMVFAYFAKAQLPFSLFRDLFNDTAEFTLCYGLHDCSHLFQGYFIHSLSTLYYYNAPSLTTRLTGDYRDRTYTGKCSPALLDTRKKNKAAGPNIGTCRPRLTLPPARRVPAAPLTPRPTAFHSPASIRRFPPGTHHRCVRVRRPD